MQKKPYAFSKSIFNRTYFQYCITGNHILSQCKNDHNPYALRPTHNGRDSATRRDFSVFKSK